MKDVFLTHDSWKMAVFVYHTIKQKQSIYNNRKLKILAYLYSRILEAKHWKRKEIKQFKKKFLMMVKK